MHVNAICFPKLHLSDNFLTTSCSCISTFFFIFWCNICYGEKNYYGTLHKFLQSFHSPLWTPVQSALSGMEDTKSSTTGDVQEKKPTDEVTPIPQEELLKAVLPPNTLPELTSTMFSNISAYLKGELLATSEDYKLLESMNLAASEKYAEMTDVAKGLTSFMKDLQIKYKDFNPYLEKIDEIDTNVTELEKTVLLLDEYTRRLETKFKNLDKALLHKEQPNEK